MNLIESSQKRYKFDEYYVIRHHFDASNYIKQNLQLGPNFNHIPSLQDLWANCKDDIEMRERSWSPLIVEQIRIQNILIDIKGLYDDQSNMLSNHYLTKIKGTALQHVTFQEPELHNLEDRMEQIIKRTKRWVEYKKKNKKEVKHRREIINTS